MSLVAAVNFVDGLILLEDNRELKITGYYASAPGELPLRANDQLRSDRRVATWEEAQVFVAEFPGTGGAHLIVEMAELHLLKPNETN